MFLGVPSASVDVTVTQARNESRSAGGRRLQLRPADGLQSWVVVFTIYALLSQVEALLMVAAPLQQGESFAKQLFANSFTKQLELAVGQALSEFNLRKLSIDPVGQPVSTTVLATTEKAAAGTEGENETF